MEAAPLPAALCRGAATCDVVVWLKASFLLLRPRRRRRAPYLDHAEYVPAPARRASTQLFRTYHNRAYVVDLRLPAIFAHGVSVLPGQASGNLRAPGRFRASHALTALQDKGESGSLEDAAHNDGGGKKPAMVRSWRLAISTAASLTAIRAPRASCIYIVGLSDRMRGEGSCGAPGRAARRLFSPGSSGRLLASQSRWTRQARHAGAPSTSDGSRSRAGSAAFSARVTGRPLPSRPYRLRRRFSPKRAARLPAIDALRHRVHGGERVKSRFPGPHAADRAADGFHRPITAAQQNMSRC